MPNLEPICEYHTPVISLVFANDHMECKDCQQAAVTYLEALMKKNGSIMEEIERRKNDLLTQFRKISP